MNRRFSIALLIALLTIACNRETPSATAAKAPEAPHANPLLEKSSLPFEAPPFDRIREADYLPAFEAGMKEQLAQIEAIAGDPAEPTFDNTIVALERSGALLSRTSRIFFNLTQSNTSDAMQKVEAEISPKLAAHRDRIFLDDRLFARVKALYDKRETAAPDAESRYLIERYHRNFVRAGALLSPKDKQSLQALNQEESTLQTKFHERLLADTAASSLVISDRTELAGLGEADLAAAEAAAKERNLTGKWVLPMQNTTLQPSLAFLTNRDVRKRLFDASIARGDHGGATDEKEIVLRLAALRAQRAKLLGFPTWAAFVLDDNMARTPEKAMKLMSDLVAPVTARAREEAKRLQALANRQGAGITIAPWDWDYYAEQVRRAEYDVSDDEVRPYFELEHVLRDGVFYSANKLYGITFRERKDLPVYHPDVRVFDVLDENGKQIALYYADFYVRPNKSGGAWEDAFVNQNRLLGQHPVVVNVMNFTKPAAGQPALLSLDNVTTLFHEFGHALHGLLSDVQYPMFSGTSVQNDFGEVPSQTHEHWAYDPAVFGNYAKHYRTGEPMPAALADRIRKADLFNQGYGRTEFLASALLDMDWHMLSEGATPSDVNAFERASLKRHHIDLPQVPPRYRTTYFSHIWDGGYAAGYYNYLWSDVIDEDAWAWFQEHGGLTRENGERFRKMILSRGGSEEAGPMYRAFRGRDASIEPLLIRYGLK